MPILNSPVEPSAQPGAEPSLPRLARQQQTFAAALLGRGDARAALAMFREPPVVAAQRLEVYRANVRAGRLSALRAAYPVVEALVGSEFFEALARAHAQEQGSTNGDLNRFGQHFARFLQGFEPVRSQSDLAYLPDVAQLEWAAHQAESAPEGPSWAAVESRFAIADIWNWHQVSREAASGQALDVHRAQTALVFRDGFLVKVVAVQAEDLARLREAA